MCPAAELSRCESAFEVDLQLLIDKYIQWWQNSPRAIPAAVIYTPIEQCANETEAGRLIDLMEQELRNYPAKEGQQSLWRDRIFTSLRKFGQSFGIPDSHFQIIFSKEYFAATRAFIHKARVFDPRMKAEPLAQALRNVWVMNCLQLFLGGQPSLTPSIFAYSMLYPYTDNHLDLAELPIESKEIACRRLGLRLSGTRINPGDAREAAVFRLIETIEGEFPRSEFPEVYSSLLAIHAGQVRSLSQQHKLRIPDEKQLLAISVAKGGSSVLADGWLVAGKLGREDADFCFGFGVVLQLLDDLQDLDEDRAAGHSTLFTRAAVTGQLDGLTNQLWSFTHRVLDSMDCYARPRGFELKDLIRRNSTMLMMRSVAECTDYFPDEYLQEMERFSPVRFAFIRDCRKEIRARLNRTWPKLARRRKLRSIFDLMG